MSETFADGEPVDPQKLRKMQVDISNLLSTANDAYSLSKATAKDVNVLNITHIKALRIDFENGLNPGYNEEKIIVDFNGYTDVFITASPRGGATHRHDITWSVSGVIGNFTLHVTNNTKQKITGVKFDIIAAGTKPSKTS
jgi:hypothetical protein